MKTIAFEKKPGVATIRSFPPKEQRDKWRPSEETDDAFIKQSMDRVGKPFFEVSLGDLPPDKDADGVSCRDCWRLKNGKVVLDKSARNIHREIYDEEKRVESLLVKTSPKVADLVNIEKSKKKIKELKDELGKR